MAPFDPYHKWLGIPETERPISKYRLLGIADFEADRDVISAAAEQRTIYLRTLQAGEHAILVAELLNEVSQARVTLLNEEQKAAYDEQLRRQQTPEPVPEPAPVPIPVVQTVAPTPVLVRGTVTQEFPVSVVQTANRPRRRKRKEIWKRPAVIGVSVVGVISVFVLVISMMSSGDAELVVQNIPPVVTSPAVAPFDMAQAKAHQKSWADHLGVTVETANSIGMEFAVIPAGEFTMGSNTFEDNEKPVHKVTLTKPFQLGVYEVTQEQYAKVVGTNPSKNKGSANPVEQVSWLDAVAFCKLLSDLPEEKASGYVYRLPTEAEWEHACRAGTTSDYSFGDGDSELGDFAWNSKNSGGTSHPVGGKQPNGFGLYDMHGNVREWCFNGLHAYPIDGSPEQQNLETTNPIRVQRGAGWNAPVDMARSSYRGRYLIHSRANDHGFRVVRLKTNSGSDLKASSLDMPQQPIRVDLLQRIHSIQGSLHQDWQKQADGTITANVKANHDITSVPVDDLISTSPYGLVIDLGNVGRRTGKPRFSIKCPYNDTKRIIVNYYYGATYNLSVGVEGAGSISTRQFLGYRALTIHVTDQYVEASLNGQVFGRIAHERGDQPTKQENAKIEFSGISGSWMHFHIRSAKLLLNPPIDGL